MAVISQDGVPVEAEYDNDLAAASSASRPGAEPAQVSAFYESLQRRRPIVTWGLLSLLVLTFLLEQYWGGSRWNATLIRMGAEVPARIQKGEWWRLLAPMCLHSGWPHFLMNSFVLFSLGPFLERLFGSSRFLVLYVASGLLGCVFGTLFASVSGLTLSVGASGALFGLLAATAVLGFRPRGQLPPALVASLKKNAIINLALNTVLALLLNIDYLAHLGGTLAGLLLVGFGTIAPTLWPRSDGRPHASLLPAILASLFGGLLVTALWVAMVHGKPWLLRQPLQFVRTPLGTTGLSIELPTVLGPAKITKRSDDATDVSIGDPQERLMELTLVLAPMPSVGPSREEQIAIFHDNAVHYRSVGLDRGAVRTDEPRQLDVAGWPALQQSLRLPDGRPMQRIDMVAHRHQIVLELREYRGLPKNLALDLTALLGTLRHDAPPPSASKEEPHG